MGGGLWVGRFAQGGVLTSELFTVSRPQLLGRGGPCGVTKAQCQGLQYRRESCGWVGGGRAALWLGVIRQQWAGRWPRRGGGSQCEACKALLRGMCS